MLLSLLLFAFFPLALSSCPPGLEPVRDGDCMGVYQTVDNARIADVLNITLTACESIQAQPVSIRNQEEQIYWIEQSYLDRDHPIVLGIVCNIASKRWEWADGSTVEYRAQLVWPEIDEDCEVGIFWIMATYPLGYWIPSQNGVEYPEAHSNIAIGCTKQLPPLPTPPEQACDYGFYLDEDNKVCYQVEMSSVSWIEAQSACTNFGGQLASIHNSQENSLIRRLAVSAEVVSGIFLGAGLTGKTEADFGWLDGSAWDYDNFMDGYPLPGVGECLIMDTSTIAGQWRNVDCSDKYAAACLRHVGLPPTCPEGPFKDAGEFSSPGYPYSSSTPCDFLLTVEEGKRVEITVNLEANLCCDHLVLLSGALYNATYTSWSSSMRVSWQPNGGVGVMGMTASFRTV